MLVRNAKYQCTAVRPEQYPEGMLPEIAFAGRSNVGKSSMINALLNRKGLARTSGTPGKTREINFYNVDGVLHFVDLPGYGYARVSKEKKQSWGAVIEEYLRTRKQLRAILLLVDIRHLPTPDDKMMYDWIRAYNIPCVITATKADKIPRSRIKPKVKEIKEFLALDEGIPVIPFSSKTKLGKDELWEKIQMMLKL